jgi:hypothetical protein
METNVTTPVPEHLAIVVTLAPWITKVIINTNLDHVSTLTRFSSCAISVANLVTFPPNLVLLDSRHVENNSDGYCEMWRASNIL